MIPMRTYLDENLLAAMARHTLSRGLTVDLAYRVKDGTWAPPELLVGQDQLGHILDELERRDVGRREDMFLEPCCHCDGTGEQHDMECLGCEGRKLMPYGYGAARKLVVDTVHYRGDRHDTLGDGQRWQVYCLGDGFGPCSEAQLVEMGWDWSHVRDSTAAGVFAMAGRIRELTERASSRPWRHQFRKPGWSHE